MKFLLTVLGVVMIVEGIPYFTMPERVKQVAAFIMDAEPRVLRIIGLSLMVLGLVIVAVTRA
ncbi:MAG: DUF2065 domain-containing protein [Candidatus Nitrospinota bacterium M3_3B_026]